MSKLPINAMIRDADAYLARYTGDPGRMGACDLACHVQALAAEVDQLERERAVLREDAFVVFRGRYPHLTEKEAERAFGQHVESRMKSATVRED